MIWYEVTWSYLTWYEAETYIGMLFDKWNWSVISSTWWRDFFWNSNLVYKLHNGFLPNIFYLNLKPHSLCRGWYVNLAVLHQEIFPGKVVIRCMTSYIDSIILNVRFQLILCYKICKWCVFASNPKLPKCRCF